MKKIAGLFLVLALSTLAQTVPSTNKLTFTVTAPQNNPVPTITSLSPNSAQAGGAAFSLTVNGTNFITTSVVNWNGAARATTFVSATQLKGSITAADIAAAGSANVSVTTPAPGGGTTGNLTFQVAQATPPPVAPTLTSLSPNSAAAGTNGVSITITGTGFVSGSAARWDGTGVTTQFVSATQIIITVPAAWITTAGTHQIDVVNPAATPPVALSIDNVTPQQATMGQMYSLQLSASGGTPPYIWNLASGTLPSGLVLTATGLISGVVAGASSSFVVQVTDSTGAAARVKISSNNGGGKNETRS